MKHFVLSDQETLRVYFQVRGIMANGSYNLCLVFSWTLYPQVKWNNASIFGLENLAPKIWNDLDHKYNCINLKFRSTNFRSLYFQNHLQEDLFPCLKILSEYCKGNIYILCIVCPYFYLRRKKMSSAASCVKGATSRLNGLKSLAKIFQLRCL